MWSPTLDHSSSLSSLSPSKCILTWSEQYQVESVLMLNLIRQPLHNQREQLSSSSIDATSSCWWQHWIASFWVGSSADTSVSHPLAPTRVVETHANRERVMTYMRLLEFSVSSVFHEPLPYESMTHSLGQPIELVSLAHSCRGLRQSVEFDKADGCNLDHSNKRTLC